MHGLSVPRDSLGVPLVRVLAQLGHNHVQVSAQAYTLFYCAHIYAQILDYLHMMLVRFCGRGALDKNSGWSACERCNCIDDFAAACFTLPKQHESLLVSLCAQPTKRDDRRVRALIDEYLTVLRSEQRTLIDSVANYNDTLLIAGCALVVCVVYAHAHAFYSDVCHCRSVSSTSKHV
jgi:hypothetical protein